MIALLWSLAHAADVGWTLAGVYDASSVRLAEGGTTKESWAWAAASGMTGSCGEAKSPDGLGLTEAQAMSSALTPTLAILLRRDSADATPLDTRSLRVAVGENVPKVLLQPAVLPRFVSVSIQGDESMRARQLVRTQLEMELCMEHKTGRAWVGAGRRELREAFLLAEPSAAEPADQMFFRGQSRAVPALIGAPDACFAETDGRSAREGGARGAGRMSLVPSDVWSASLRPCNDAEVGGALVARPPAPLPLAFGDATLAPPTWDALEVSLSGVDDAQVEAQVRFAGETVLEAGHKLFSPNVDADGEARDALTDILAQAPYRYPTLGTADDPGRYVLLLVPGWQLDVARLAVDGEAPDVADGVGWLLQHPDLLFVQVRPPREDADWPDLADAIIARRTPLLAWGYMVGSLEGRSPIPLLGRLPATWKQVMAAQRGESQSAVLGALAILGVLLFFGVRRIRDLWTTVPEERVDYWPGEAPEAGGLDGKSSAGELLGTEE